jgi:hypothetical protein
MDAETIAAEKSKFYLDRFGSMYPNDENVREFLDVVFGKEYVRARLRIRRHRGRAYIVDKTTDCILGSGPNPAEAAIEADAKFKQTLSGTTPENQPPTKEENNMSWNRTSTGLAKDVAAEICADPHIPGEIKAAVILGIPQNPPKGYSNGLQVHTSGHIDSALGGGFELKVTQVQIAPPAPPPVTEAQVDAAPLPASGATDGSASS